MPDDKDPEKTAKPSADAPVPAMSDAKDASTPATALDDARTAMDASAADDSDEARDEERSGEPEDAARPEAVLKRVEALGEEDESERVAREEENKLAERRRVQKKGKKRGGLEAAASKRLAKIGAKAPVRRTVATAADTDAVVDRAVEFGEWAKKNQGLVGIVAALGVLALVALSGYAYLHHKHELDASVQFARAVGDQFGRIGDPPKDDDTDAPRDPRPLFRTVEDRREAALKGYRDVETRFPGTGAAILSRLSEGSLLLDKHDVDGAVSAFDDVKVSPLAHADAEVRGRSLEGLGFAYELKAEAAQGDAKTAALDDALKTFRELENTDVKGFKELGMYHQARVFEAKGDKDKAIQLLKSLHERVSKPDSDKAHPYPYLETVTDDRLRALDPSALPPKNPGTLGGPGGNQMSEAQIRKLIEQMQRQQAQKQGGGAPPGPPGQGAPK